MNSTADKASNPFDTAQIMGGMYGEGIIGLARAFPRAWAEKMGRDIDASFAKALAVPGGALPRGPERFYVEVTPESISGFVDIATHP